MVAADIVTGGARREGAGTQGENENSNVSVMISGSWGAEDASLNVLFEVDAGLYYIHSKKVSNTCLAS